MKKGDEAHWIRFGDTLRTYILSKVHNKALADDLLQEVFIKIHAHIDQLKDHTKIRSWMVQITKNVVTDYFRSLKKEHQNSFEQPIDVAVDDSEDMMTEAIQDMLKMMDKLPPKYCEALCATELDGMSQKDYAAKLGISYTAAKSRVQRARRMLRDDLMNCCHYQFDTYGTVLDIFPANCCCCSDQHGNVL